MINAIGGLVLGMCILTFLFGIKNFLKRLYKWVIVRNEDKKHNIKTER